MFKQHKPTRCLGSISCAYCVQDGGPTTTVYSKQCMSQLTDSSCASCVYLNNVQCHQETVLPRAWASEDASWWCPPKSITSCQLSHAYLCTTTSCWAGGAYYSAAQALRLVMYNWGPPVLAGPVAPTQVQRLLLATRLVMLSQV